MIVKYRVTGEIEVDLDKYDIKNLESSTSETMKKAFLEEILMQKLNSCALAGENELDVKVDFTNLYVVKDWKYAGNIKEKNEKYGSPLAITLDKFPTTEEELVENTIEEIENRKTHHKKHKYDH